MPFKIVILVLKLVPLPRHQAKLIRVRSEGQDLAVQCNVRWTPNRPALYRDLLVWMLTLDAVLVQAPQRLTERRHG